MTSLTSDIPVELAQTIGDIAERLGWTQDEVVRKALSLFVVAEKAVQAGLSLGVIKEHEDKSYQIIAQFENL